MAKDKRSFLLYSDIIHTVEKMPDEKAGQLFKHILGYVNDRNPETDDLIIQLTFEPIRQQLKRDLLKYQTIKEKNKENALKRWDKKDATACDRIQTDAKHAVNDNDNDNDNDLKEEDKMRVFSFKKSLFDLGVEENVANDWLKVRKNKKATNTETAFNKIKVNIEKSGMSANDCIKRSVEESWAGFSPEWEPKLSKGKSFNPKNTGSQSTEQDYDVKF